jgi:hypothetical protein
MIKIDGTDYNVEWVTGTLEQTADILNGENSGRLQGTKSMYLEYIGTFFNTSVQIRRAAACTDAEWDNLYLTLANPVNAHTVVLPFGQGTIETEIYISQVKRKFISRKYGRTLWEKVYDVTFTAIDSQWLAGDEEIKGYSEEA